MDEWQPHEPVGAAEAFHTKDTIPVKKNRRNVMISMKSDDGLKYKEDTPFHSKN